MRFRRRSDSVAAVRGGPGPRATRVQYRVGTAGGERSATRTYGWRDAESATALHMDNRLLWVHAGGRKDPGAEYCHKGGAAAHARCCEGESERETPDKSCEILQRSAVARRDSNAGRAVQMGRS